MKFVEFSLLTGRAKLNRLVRQHRKAMLGQNTTNQRGGRMTEMIVPLMYGDFFTNEGSRGRFERREGGPRVETSFTGTLKK
jgi:hypothetical protein